MRSVCTSLFGSQSQYCSATDFVSMAGVGVRAPLSFIYLPRTRTVRGFFGESQSGLQYSNFDPRMVHGPMDPGMVTNKAGIIKIPRENTCVVVSQVSRRQLYGELGPLVWDMSSIDHTIGRRHACHLGLGSRISRRVASRDVSRVGGCADRQGCDSACLPVE